MKKKILLLSLMLLLVFSLAGCEGANPYITVQNNGWTYSSYNRDIQIDKGYIMDQSHSYDIIQTEEGIDVVIHYLKEAPADDTTGD